MQSLIITPERKMLAIELLRELKRKFPKVAEMSKNNIEVEDIINEEILKIVDLDVR